MAGARHHLQQYPTESSIRPMNAHRVVILMYLFKEEPPSKGTRKSLLRRSCFVWVKFSFSEMRHFDLA